MKKILCYLLAIGLFPFAFCYGLVRMMYLNKNLFYQVVNARHLARLQREYQRKYNNFQLELIRDEN